MPDDDAEAQSQQGHCLQMHIKHEAPGGQWISSSMTQTELSHHDVLQQVNLKVVPCFRVKMQKNILI